MLAELIMDKNYYNKLDIEGFSKMMSSLHIVTSFIGLKLLFS